MTSGASQAAGRSAKDCAARTVAASNRRALAPASATAADDPATRSGGLRANSAAKIPRATRSRARAGSRSRTTSTNKRSGRASGDAAARTPVNRSCSVRQAAVSNSAAAAKPRASSARAARVATNRPASRAGFFSNGGAVTVRLMRQIAIVTKMFDSSRSVARRAATGPQAVHLASALAGLGVAILLLLPVPAEAPAWLPGGLPAWLAQADKAVHASLFFLLTGIWLRSFERLARWPRPIASAMFFAATYGALLEGLQHLAPERTSSLADAGANLAGALLLGAVVVLVRRTKSP